MTVCLFVLNDVITCWYLKWRHAIKQALVEYVYHLQLKHAYIVSML